MINDKEDEVNEELLASVIKKYQIGLEKSKRGSDFIFDCIHLLYYKCHKMNLNYGGSYIAYSDWRKNKKTPINPINKKDNNAFNML